MRVCNFGNIITCVWWVNEHRCTIEGENYLCRGWKWLSNLSETNYCFINYQLMVVFVQVDHEQKKMFGSGGVR